MPRLPTVLNYALPEFDTATGPCCYGECVSS